MQALPVGDNGCAGGNIAGCSNGGVATAEGTACERGAACVFTKFTKIVCYAKLLFVMNAIPSGRSE